MNSGINIQIRAAILLSVFCLNTVIGFGCAISMEFNTNHHKADVTESSAHVHADGKKHKHQTLPLTTAHHEGKEISKKDKDGCCNDDVLKFQNLDKNLNQNARIAIDAPALVSILSSFLGIDILKVPEAPHQLYTARYLFPPPDILISIHRFRI